MPVSTKIQSNGGGDFIPVGKHIQLVNSTINDLRLSVVSNSSRLALMYNNGFTAANLEVTESGHTFEIGASGWYATA